MSSNKEKIKNQKAAFRSVEDIRTSALFSYTAILSKTIYLFQLTESQGMPLHQASSIVFDFMRNYTIYSLPIELLKDTTTDMNQFKHDCFVLTKETIDSCNVSDREKETLSSILKEAFYDFPAKTYNNLGLVPYITYLTNGISFENTELDNEEVLVFKTLCYPLITFYAHKYPLLESAAKEEIEKDIDIFLTNSINAYAQMCLYDKLVYTQSLTAVQAALHLLNYCLDTLNKILQGSVFEHSMETLFAGYKILVEVSENKKDPELDKLLEVFDKYRKQAIKQQKSKDIKKDTGDLDEQRSKTKRKVSTNTTVSRTTTKGRKRRTENKFSNSIQPSRKKKSGI
jgi:hypothetical protein